MKKPFLFLVAIFFLPSLSWSASYDIVEFFQEENTVVTSASRNPRTINQSPATVYVVTADDIRSSGAQNLWDALRQVPGVDVMSLRSYHGEVGIRGLNKASNNRVLVLLDGRSVLNGFFDYVNWDAIPITMEEVDRIEVVEGPVSAIYGANAISGVINIITRTPDQIKNGSIGYAAGERQTHLASGLYAGESGKVAYKVGAGWKYGNRFEDAGRLASEVSKLHALVRYSPEEDSEVQFSGGASNHDTQLSSSADAFDDGVTSFARFDARWRQTRFRSFWNRGRTELRNTVLAPSLSLDYDTADASLEESLELPYDNSLVAGLEYKRNSARSNIFPPEAQTQNLWSLFFEDLWRPFSKWSFSLSGRVDKHPLTRWVFSPRGSIVYNPAPTQTLRFSAGTAFRSPTLVENYLFINTSVPNPGSPAVPNPPYSLIQALVTGNPDVAPESFLFQELFHGGRFGPLKTTVAVFHYELSDLITANTQVLSAVPPSYAIRSDVINLGAVEAWGGEAGVEADLTKKLGAFANYSNQSLRDSVPTLQIAQQSPRNKVNAGIRYRRWGATGNLWMHWVDETAWPRESGQVGKVSDYVLLNARVGYEFTGRWKGLEVGVNAFNLAGNDHYEILPPVSLSQTAQGGEIIRSRWTVSAVYRF